MKKVFVSGCYDILHGGHIQFFREARSLGNHLTVCLASDEVLWEHKKRRASLPQDHKLLLISSLVMVDQVVIGNCREPGMDFKNHFLQIKPDILAVTEDDQYSEAKRKLCIQAGVQYVVLPKTPPQTTPVSTSSIVRNIRTPSEAPLRIDFAGGWLDVPRFSREGAYIVNCAISPMVSLNEWDYEQKAGLGGSGAWALLNGNDGVESELELGVGWQDPVVIRETGMCVWCSGPRPKLDFKRNGDFLHGLMALHFTGLPHDTPSFVDYTRDFNLIERAGHTAREGVLHECVSTLGKAVNLSYQAQVAEGMQELPQAENLMGAKYCGGGWGGYALYLFNNQKYRDAFVASANCNRPVEPYITIR